MSEFCNFCKIVSGKDPASIIYENRNVIAFMDLHPANRGHVLVIPRKHWETIYEVPENVLADVFAVVKRISVAVKKAVDAEGIGILQLNEEAAGQSVKHFHVHVIPRFRGDTISKFMGAMRGHGGFEKAKRQDLDEIVKKIREIFEKIDV